MCPVTSYMFRGISVSIQISKPSMNHTPDICHPGHHLEKQVQLPREFACNDAYNWNQRASFVMNKGTCQGKHLYRPCQGQTLASGS